MGLKVAWNTIIRSLNESVSTLYNVLKQNISLGILASTKLIDLIVILNIDGLFKIILLALTSKLWPN